MDTLDWALREMRGPEGGFYSALDADSEGVEGRFYVWREQPSCEDVLGDRTRPPRSPGSASSEQGNFRDPHHPEPGLNVLQDRGPRRPPRAARAHPRARCWQARERRVRPGLDDKRLTSWNALMVAASPTPGPPCRAALHGRRDRLRGVHRAAHCARRDGRLLRSFNEGSARIAAYLEDHAFLLEALLVLFETSCEERFFLRARALADDAHRALRRPRAKEASSRPPPTAKP